MKFNEAMELVKTGAKVTRESWKNILYFQMIKDDIKTFQPHISPYIYNEDIMISTGWNIEGEDGEYSFYDTIPYLQKGKKILLKSWNECYVYYEESSASLVLHSMDIFPFIPDFHSFVAQDWIELK